MIALRYFCGFSLQIFPYAFFCLYPFRDRFRLSTKKTMLMALSIFIVMVIPFSLIAQFNIGGDYKELIWNVIFYIALLLFGVLYCFIIQAKIAEKLFVFFVVMSYGFFVTSTVTFLHRTFRFPSDYFMYPPFALALTLIINLVLAKPFLILMERIRTMINADLESRMTGIVDSGVDYFHPDFRNADGNSRILRLWDQSIQGNPPQGYVTGTEYTKEQIDEALALGENQGRRLVPSVDYSGHGTSVLGIAAGNGRASDGVNQGVAYESDLIVVKMGIPRENSFPRTTELIQGIDYLVRQSLSLGRPMVINISFGNNYGSHKGDSLLETYIDMVSSAGRLVICTGTGNNGNQPLHEGGTLKQGQTRQIELSVSSREPTLNVQLWKSYEDEMSIYIENPSGNRIGPLDENLGPQRYRLGNTELLIYYGKPGPYHLTQEIYIDFLPVETYVDSGDWKIILSGKKVRGGEYYLWLPGGNTLNRGTGFYEPRAYGTLTIPATARRIIAVGAYDSLIDSYADFSGRGSRMLPYLKPDLVAPGVNIVAPVLGGGYRIVTGTSFAAPFVSGAAALLLQWGIVNGNDPYLYGEKVKAYFRRGARPLSGYETYPNEEVGWGALCLENSFPK